MLAKRIPKKNSAAVALGRKGGKNSRKNLSPEERTRLAKKAVAVRWAKSQPQKQIKPS